MLTTKKAIEAKASSISIIKTGDRAYSNKLFDLELIRPLQSSVFFMVTDIENRRSAASYKAKKQNLIKCN